jgi:hypothetical protein
LLAKVIRVGNGVVKKKENEKNKLNAETLRRKDRRRRREELWRWIGRPTLRKRGWGTLPFERVEEGTMTQRSRREEPGVHRDKS